MLDDETYRDSPTKMQDEAIFWLYIVLREEIFPMCSFESNTVMKSAFNFLFEKLDPMSFKILGTTPGDYFGSHFATLFYDINPEVFRSVFDLLLVFGSGSMRGTLVDLQDLPVNDDFPLCRT